MNNSINPFLNICSSNNKGFDSNLFPIIHFNSDTSPALALHSVINSCGYVTGILNWSLLLISILTLVVILNSPFSSQLLPSIPEGVNKGGNFTLLSSRE